MSPLDAPVGERSGDSIIELHGQTLKLAMQTAFLAGWWAATQQVAVGGIRSAAASSDTATQAFDTYMAEGFDALAK